MSIIRIISRLSIVLLVATGAVSADMPEQEKKPAEGNVKEAVGVEGVPDHEVTFLSDEPDIDGVLDESLSHLPVREFKHVIKRDAENESGSAVYRLAYGTHFFYVYIEAEANNLVFRDRAYQNGDGFHMVLALPQPDKELSDEFYVLACSAVENPGMEWSRRFIWYYNVDNLFLRLSEDARMEFSASNGKISFELLLPWKDVHPYHPWISRQIGFNLCFVKGVGDAGKIYHFVLPDRHMQSENRSRMYTELRFEKPRIATGRQTFVVLEKNHVVEGERLEATAVTVSDAPAEERVFFRVKSGEGDRIASSRSSYDCSVGLTSKKIAVDGCRNLSAGGYRIEWSASGNGSKGETGLSVLPAFDADKMETRLSKLEGTLSESSIATLRLIAEEIKEELEAVKPYETCGPQRTALARLQRKIEEAEKGNDVLAGETGLIRRAFRSDLDGTLQPYCLRLPNDYNPAKKYPLLVYLHGSASDETSLGGFDILATGDFIELAPRARGTSNVYVKDNAQEDIAEAIEAVIRNYSIDPDKMFLSGFSMGGYGVYRTYYGSPGKFKALVVFSGHPNMANRWLGGGDYPNFLEEKYLEVFKGVPIFIFHGKKDLNCPFSMTVELVDKLKAAGAEVEFHFEEDKGHELPGKSTTEILRMWLKKRLQTDK